MLNHGEGYAEQARPQLCAKRFYIFLKQYKPRHQWHKLVSNFRGLILSYPAFNWEVPLLLIHMTPSLIVKLPFFKGKVTWPRDYMRLKGTSQVYLVLLLLLLVFPRIHHGIHRGVGRADGEEPSANARLCKAGQQPLVASFALKINP